LETTTQLTAIVKAAIPASARREGGNPAKRTFQALRISVNDELTQLESGIDAALRWLNPQGRIAVISYHSLEDRIVKEAFAQAAKGCICPPEAPLCVCGHEPILKLPSRKPLSASEEEIEANPRSKSAKLRVALKL
jgi:16S rRNA (cytosine1402-N4)-methyltransferase